MNVKKFCRDNDLKQVDLAEYLQISAPSISRAYGGKTNFSESNLRKLLNNDRGWDISALLEDDDGDNINHVDGNNNITINNGNVDSELVKSLRKQIALLEDQVAELKKDKDELREWLKEIRGGTPSSRAT